MTLAQFLERVRRRHNDEDTTNQFFGEQEVYQYLTDRCNEVLSVIGQLEAVDTSNTSVADTQTVSYPTNTTTIRQVDYKNDRLQRITFREAEDYKTDSGFTSGRPDKWFPWNRTIYLVPVPDTTGDAITIYHYELHPEIDNSSQTTIDIPAVLHTHLITGVLADMFSKDQNAQLTSFYESKWQSVCMDAFYKFKVEEDTASRFQITGDSDGMEATELGIK